MGTKQSISWGILLGVALITTTFSYFATWLGDDIYYQYSCVPGEENLPIRSFLDIIRSQNAHYLIRNGRYVTHCLVQVFCVWGQTAFAIANGVVYILFFRLLCHLCGVKMTNAKGVLMVVLLGLITFQTRMTPAFQINYIWTFTFMMIFLSLFFQKDTNRWPWWKTCIVGIFSLLAGNGQEALSIGLGAALIIYWLGNMKNMTMTKYIMMVCFGLGALLCCLSPGNFEHAEKVVPAASAWIQWVIQIFLVFLCIRSFYFLFVVLLCKKAWRHRTWTCIYKTNNFYWNAWFALLMFNAFLGFLSYNRPWFGMELLSIIIGVRLVDKNFIKPVWLCMLSLLLALSYVWQIKRVFYCRTIMTQIESLYEKSLNGNIHVDIDRIYTEDNQQNAYSYIRWYSYIPSSFSDKSYDRKQVTHLLNVKYPGRQPLQIIPTCLKGKENVKLHNQIVDYSSGIILAIQSKSNPAPLYVNRCINILGYKRAYEPLEIPFDETNTLCEGKYWRACLVDVNGYYIITPYICDINICFDTK